MTWRALRARRLVPLADEGLCTGQDLFRAPVVHDDGLLLLCEGTVVYAGTYRPQEVPLGVQVEDLGGVTLVPAAVNAHAHIQLSHLAGQTLWDQGFVPWLRSLIPLLARPLEPAAVEAAVRAMLASGTGHVGDYTSHGMALVGQAAQRHGLGCTLLAEWFGFAVPEVPTVWPPRCVSVLEDVPQGDSIGRAPAGHALYSTDETLLRQAHAWCVAHQSPFAMHLAEFPEEVEALTAGTGALVDLYRPVVLPLQWRAPGLPPVALAEHWGLLGPQTLAVHCVQCAAQDVDTLARTGTRVCLCPRSNAHLAVGTAPVSDMVRTGVALCLGTDGLTSNTDMDVWQETVYLLQQGILPAVALLRMTTCNGAAALHRKDVGTLRPGARGAWAILPSVLDEVWP